MMFGYKLTSDIKCSYVYCLILWNLFMCVVLNLTFGALFLVLGESIFYPLFYMDERSFVKGIV